MKHLKAKGKLIVQNTIRHTYPFCWRSVSFRIFLRTHPSNR